MAKIIFTGEFDATNHNLVHYTGQIPVGGSTVTLTLDLHTDTGEWLANVPPTVPAWIDIIAIWQDLSTRVIRSNQDVFLRTQPLPAQDSIGRPEGAIIESLGESSYSDIWAGASEYVDGGLIDESPWSRSLTCLGDTRLAEGFKFVGQAQALIIVRQPTVLDQGNTPWLVSAVCSQAGIEPLQLSLEQVDEFGDCCFALKEGIVSTVYSGATVAGVSTFTDHTLTGIAANAYVGWLVKLNSVTEPAISSAGQVRVITANTSSVSGTTTFTVSPNWLPDSAPDTGSGYVIYTLVQVGLVYGVLVADPQAFFSIDFYTDLWEWWPFNEHPESAMVVKEAVWGSCGILSQFLNTDRQLVRGWGWALYVPRGRSVTLQMHKEFPGGPATVMFRFSPHLNISNSDGTTTLFQLGALRVAINYTASTGAMVLAVQVLTDPVSITWVTQASTTISLTTDYLVEIIYDGSVIASVNLWRSTDPDLSPVWTAVPGATNFTLGAPDTIVVGEQPAMEDALSYGPTTFTIRDLRVWTAVKSVIKFRTPVQRITPQGRWPTTVLTPTGVSWAMKAYSNSSFIYLDRVSFGGGLLPASNFLERESVKLLMSEVDVRGDPRVDDVGLDSGLVPTVPWLLGYHDWPVMVDGRVVVSTQNGIIGSNSTWPGTLSEEPNRNVAFHRVWAAVQYSGTSTDTITLSSLTIGQVLSLSAVSGTTGWTTGGHVRFISSESPSAGAFFDATIVSSTSFRVIGTVGSVSSSSWRILYRSIAWEIKAVSVLNSDGTNSARLQATQVASGGRTMRLVDGGGYLLTVSLGGVISRGPHVGSFPTLFLYTSSTTVADLGPSTSTTLLSSWVDPNSFGLGPGVNTPATNQRGSLTFYMAAALVAGPYRLTLNAGNIGQVPEGFAGLNIEVTVGQVMSFPMVVTGTGMVNPTGTITYDFELPEAVGSGWLLEISWGGKLNAPQQNVSYALAIYEVVVERTLPTLYRVDSPTVLTPLDVSENASLSSSVPGGWVGIVNWDGTISGWVHESDPSTRILPDGGLGGPTPWSTVTSAIRVPASVLSESVAGVTARRREDILPTSPLIPNSIQSFVAAGVLAVSPVGPSSFSLAAGTIISETFTPFDGSTPNQGSMIVYQVSEVSNATALVWAFWDGTIVVTVASVTQQSKVANTGGSLSVTVTAVDDLGRSTSQTVSTTVNHAPQVISLNVSDNDQAPGYSTAVTVATVDPDSSPGGSITGSIGSATPQTITSIVSGHVQGTMTFDLTIIETADLTLTLADNYGATFSMPISFRVVTSQPVVIAVTAIPPDITIPPAVTVNPVPITIPTTVMLTAVALDLDGYDIETFVWQLTEANGWATDQYLSGTTQAINGGASQNVLVIDMTGQSPGMLTAVVKVTTTIGKIGYGSVDIVVAQDVQPVVDFFHVEPLSETGPVTAGQPAIISVTATSPVGTALAYAWTFTNPSATTRVGNPVIVTPSSSSAIITGSVVVTDVLGASTTATIPPVIISSPLTVNAVLGAQLTYMLTAMGLSPTFTALQMPPGMTLIGNIISGVPTVAGTFQIQVTATDVNSKMDTRTIFVTVTAGAVPLAPTNLLVKGSSFPTYRAGDSIPVTWVQADRTTSTILKFYVLGSQVTMLGVTLRPGVNSYLLSNVDLVAAFTAQSAYASTGYQGAFVVRAFASNGVNTSNNYVEIAVDFLT
jgi:hypothetical protein